GSGTDSNYDARAMTDGMFWWGSAVKFRDLTDGTTNTAMISEALLGNGIDTSTAVGLDPERQMAQYGGGGMGAAGEGFRAAPGTSPVLAAAAPGVGRGMRRGRWSRVWRREHLNSFNAYPAPNSAWPDVARNGFGWFSARILHRGGVNLVLADGSIRFVSEN